jgi:hypothetical protein
MNVEHMTNAMKKNYEDLKHRNKMIGYEMKTYTNVYYLKVIYNMEPNPSYERFSSMVMLLVKCIGS